MSPQELAGQRGAERDVALSILADLRVLDLSTSISGAYCTKLLADLGADVVKLEPCGGDPLRRWSASGTELAGHDGPLFQFLCTSKRSVVDDGPEQRDALLAGADVLVEDGSVDDAALARIRSRFPLLAIVSISWYGRSGPWAARPATEFTLQASCGSTGSRGKADGPPASAGGRIGEWLAGAYAAFAALAVSRVPAGDHVDVSTLECMAIAFHGYAALKQSLGATGFPVSKRAVELPSIERASDGYVTITTNSRQQFDDFLAMIDRPDLIGDEAFATKAARQLRAEEFTAIVDAWMGSRSAREVAELASLLRIPAAELVSPDRLAAVGHFRERGVFIENPSGGFLQPRPPLRSPTAPSAPLRRSPEPDEHRGRVQWVARTDRHLPAVAELPLAGCRVIDATAWWAGPACGAMFAALGADVVKVESIQRPDGQRFSNTAAMPPQDRWWETAYLFQAANLNKRGVTLDLTNVEGRELMLELLAVSDVFVENFTPRVLDNFDLGWDTVRAVNPQLVMVRMPAFGLEGPWKGRTGFAQTMESVTGMAWMTGFPDERPLLPLGPCDPLAGMTAAAAGVAGLIHRDRTGEGTFFEAPMVESALNAAAEAFVEWSAHGVVLTRAGNRGPQAAPQGVYRCTGEDRWVAIAVTDDARWNALAALIGAPELAEDRELSTPAGRIRSHARIDRVVEQWTSGRRATEVAAALVAIGVPAAVVDEPVDVAANEQLRARGFVEAFDHPLLGRHEVLGVPFRLASHDGRWIRTPAPTLGQHNHEVLGGLLGRSDAELDRLRRAKVIGDVPLNG